MADEILRTIYKLEIDDSAYIKGVESLAASTNKLSQAQQASNKALQENEAQLKKQAAIVEQSRKALESYAGADTKQKEQLQRTLKAEQDAYVKMQELVANVRRSYEAANKAAQDFGETAKRAGNLPIQPGGRVPLPPVSPQPVPQLPPITPETFNNFNLTDILEANTVEFDKLRVAIEAAEAALAGMNQESDEFKQLAPVVEQGKKALADYDAAASKAGESILSLRSQIRQGREELVKMEQAGKANSKEYFELEKRVASLTDAYGDQQQRIKILASDTKLLDFGKGAITAATSAFQAYTAVSILAGDQSEELQKKTMQLFAAMQLLQSLEQLSNLTRREGVLATLAQSGAQSAYTAVVGASTGALRVFRLALAATGIGIVIAGIATLVIAMQEMNKEAEEANRKQKLLNDTINAAGSEYENAVKNVNELRINIDLAKKGFIDKETVVKQYNETIGKTTGEVNSLNQAEQELNKNAEAYIQFTLFKAAANIALQESSKKVFEAEKEQREQRDNIIKDLKGTEGAAAGFGLEASQKDLDEAAANSKEASDDRIDQSKKESKDLLDIATDFQKRAAEISKEFKFNFDGGGGDTKKVENEFAKRLRDLQAKLAEVTAKSFESEGTIRKQFQASLEKEIADINDLVKAGKLTKSQAKILIDLTAQINQVQLNEALDQFNKKVLDARKKLNEEIRLLQQQNTEETIKLLQDEFERRKQLIDFNEKQQIADTEKNTADRLAALEQERNLIGEQAYQDAKNEIVKASEDEQTNIVIQAARDRQDLAADSFRSTLDILNSLFEDQLLNIDEAAAAKIKEQKELFNAGVINYDEFQKQITKILSDQKKERDRLRLLELNSELGAINNRLGGTISDAERKSLTKRQNELRKQIAEIESQTDTNDPGKKKVETVADYANAIGGLTDSIIQFWNKANEAEAAALDRSIAIQERRVDAAQRIAERGNAQYLKAEEDRLKELQVARENAARRQLGIDAALQASQVLVGITGAIAKIATPGIGIAETIGAIGVIVGALATGYGLVKSLQGNQPTFFVGTKDTGKGGKQDHRGGFTAVLHPHEAVIPRDKNEKYKPTIDAIFDGRIHPDVINDFVLKHNSIKRVPQVNYDRIKDAAELKISHDGKMAVILTEHSKLLQRNNELQEEIVKKKTNINASIDRNGVAIAVTEYINQREIDKHI